MKQDRIRNLYTGLTNKERAALSFRYILDANEVELLRVGDTVQLKTYRCHDAEYSDCVQGFFTLASLWGLIYWQNYSSLMASIALIHATIAGNTTDDLNVVIGMAEYWKRRLLALNVALASICAEHGIDSDIVRRYADIEPDATKYADLLPDAEYLAYIQSSLGSAIAMEAY
jgi:hypothetical protein